MDRPARVGGDVDHHDDRVARPLLQKRRHRSGQHDLRSDVDIPTLVVVACDTRSCRRGRTPLCEVRPPHTRRHSSGDGDLCRCDWTCWQRRHVQARDRARSSAAARRRPSPHRTSRVPPLKLTWAPVILTAEDFERGPMSASTLVANVRRDSSVHRTSRQTTLAVSPLYLDPSAYGHLKRCIASLSDSVNGAEGVPR